LLQLKSQHFVKKKWKKVEKIEGGAAELKKNVIAIGVFKMDLQKSRFVSEGFMRQLKQLQQLFLQCPFPS
jgi:hypothetical protein